MKRTEHGLTDPNQQDKEIRHKMGSDVIFEKRGKTAYITLNRPKQKNAINLAVRQGLCDAWDEINRDTDIASVILTGGENVFSTGQDLVELAEFRKTEPTAELPLNDHNTFGIHVEKPVIAAIGGYCLGAGFLLTMLCGDIRIAADTAKFGMPEVNVGVPPSFGIPPLLAKSFPYAIAVEILLAGKNITAEAACQFGYVNKIVPAQDLMAAAEAYAARINDLSPLIVKNIKKVLRQAASPDPVAISFSDAICALGRKSEDYIEGPKAFREKRKPVWKGR